MCPRSHGKELASLLQCRPAYSRQMEAPTAMGSWLPGEEKPQTLLEMTSTQEVEAERSSETFQVPRFSGCMPGHPGLCVTAAWCLPTSTTVSK